MTGRDVYTALLAQIEPPPAMVRRIVRLAQEAEPRSRQQSIGLSEIGDPCDRAVAYKIAASMFPNAVTRHNVGRDIWLATIGTATHAWLAAAFEAENARLGRQRFLIEQRVELAPGLEGTCDLFDDDLGDVLDHKILGALAYSKIRDGLIPAKYRVQIHSYGRGHERAGRTVKRVGLLVYPRNDNLAGDFSGKGLLVHTEPYSRDLAVAAVERVEAISMAVAELLPFSKFATSPDAECRWCPFFRPGHDQADNQGCPGVRPTIVPRDMAGII